MAVPGVFVNLLEKHEVLTDKKTKKAETKSIKKNDYVAPAGHISFVKHGVDEDGLKTSYLIFHNGAAWNQGRTWDFSEDWFCLEINWNSSSISSENLQHVQAFHVTTKSQGAAMENCSTSFGYVLSAGVDLTDAGSDTFEVVIFGGQSTETAKTSNRLEVVTGPSDFDGALHCKAYRSEPRLYKEYKLPEDYSPELDLIQNGTVPSSRCGHTLGKLSPNLLVCIGGLTIPAAAKHKFHPSDSNIFLLKYPEIEWIKLDKIEELNRTEHSMHIVDGKIYIVGGYSFRNHLASEIFPYNHVLEIEIKSSVEDNEVVFWSSIKTIVVEIMPDFGSPFLTSMSSVGNSNCIYLFGGYSWPSYDPSRQNMFELCPPYTSHNKKPKQESNLVILDLAKSELQMFKGSSDFATADGSLQVLSKDENDLVQNLLIVGGSSQRLDFYSTFDFSLHKCDLIADHGGCEVTISTRDMKMLTCSKPTCSKEIHIICGKHTRGLQMINSDRYVCPTCADIDPVTKKKRTRATRRAGGAGVR